VSHFPAIPRVSRLAVVPLAASAQRPGGSSRRGSHRLASVLECPRRWFLHTYMGIDQKYEPDYFTRGSLIHLLLAFHYAKGLNPRPAWLSELDLDTELAATSRGQPALIQTAREVYTAYVAKGYDQNGAPYAVEHEIAATIGQIKAALGDTSPESEWDSEVVTSRIDLMVVIGGLVYFKDYKSTLRGTGSALPRWTPNNEFSVKFQFMLQEALGRTIFGKHFGGVMIQRLKCKMPFDMDEHLLPQPPAFMAQLIPLLRRCVAEEAKYAAEADAKSDLELETWLPLGQPWSCFSYGKPCEYMPLCNTDSEAVRLLVQPELYTRKVK